jgi:hypothetical protein
MGLEPGRLLVHLFLSFRLGPILNGMTGRDGPRPTALSHLRLVNRT